MRIVGQRKERPVGLLSSCTLLAEDASFNDEIHRLPTGNMTFIPKGLYRFKTHEEAEKHHRSCLARGMEPEWFTEGDNIRGADAFLVDVMLNASGETYATLGQYAITVDLDGIPVRTVSQEGLLRTKQTVRDKDVADRHILEQALALLKMQSAE